ncbi:MAG: S8 family peptidase [Flavobacteriales bacterium]
MNRFLIVVFLFPIICFSQQKANPWLISYLNQNRENQEQVSLFVKGEVNELKKILSKHNGVYKGSVKEYHFVTISFSGLTNLLENSAIWEIDFNMYAPDLLNDTMRTNNRVNDVHIPITPLNYPVTGKGVIVGIIDDGCELDHDDFKNPDGTTRILKIWDHSQSFDPVLTPTDFGYGREYDSVMINAGQAVHNNPQGHGTTVTGSAVGNGLATGTHKGVAPDAHLVIVKSNFSLPNWTSTIADAVDYIFRVADAEGMPCVINASLGTYLGSHDGLDATALYIDSLIDAKRGRLMVCAAGNSGHMPAYHLGYDVTSDTTFTWFKVNSSNSPLGVPGVLLEIWADTADFNQIYFSVGADKVNPNFQFRGSTQYYNVSDLFGGTVHDSIMNAGNKIAHVEYSAQLRGGQYVFYVSIPSPDSLDYNFRLSFTGNGRFDTWSAQWFRLNDMVTNVPSSIDFPDIVNYKFPDTLQSIVSSWACSPKVITTANYNNAMGYIDMVGNLQVFSQPPGTRATTSSRGPNRLGYMKPDIAASGNGTLSACPVNLQGFYAANDPSFLAQGGKHIRNGGTSMASPVVAGAGALLLERCPQLDANYFKTIITSTTYNDQHTGMNLPNVLWGAGKIDVFAAVASSLNTPVITSDFAYCEGDSLELVPDANYLSYAWSDGSLNSYLTVNQPGQNWFYGIDQRGCVSDTLYFSVTELSIPQIPVILYQNDTLFSSVIEDEFQWYFNGLAIVSSNDSILVNPPLGNYVVEVINADGCSSFSNPYAVTAVGEVFIDKILVYPNPFDNEIIIYGAKAGTQILIYDNLGKTILNKLVTHDGRFTLYTESYVSGVYFINLISGDSSITHKLMHR